MAGNDIFEGAPGAYTNALAMARDAEEFSRLVKETFREQYLCVRGIEDIRPLAWRELNAAWRQLAAQLSATSPVVYDTFYIYESEEE